MGMFDPIYVTEVINDILSRRGLELTMAPKENPGPPPERPEGSARLPSRHAG